MKPQKMPASISSANTRAKTIILAPMLYFNLRIEAKPANFLERCAYLIGALVILRSPKGSIISKRR